MSEDVRILQDPKIIQQILGKFPDHGNQINVIMIGQMNQEATVKEAPQHEINSETLLSYVDSLPEPRIKSLVSNMMLFATAKYNTEEEAAKWLGISSRTMRNYKRKEIPFYDEG